jgi:DNA repair protein RadC
MRRRSYITSLRLVRETTVPATEPPAHVRGPCDVVRLMAPLAAIEPAEVLWVIALNAQHRILGGPIVITRGLLDSSPVHAREVFRAAIAAGAAAIVLVHNHPSGDPSPSSDVRVTRELRDAGNLLEIPVLDHVIVGGTGAFQSLAEIGDLR